MKETTAAARFVLYARKSTESEERQVQSIEDQTRLCRDLARREGWRVVREITEARSARKQGARPGFAEVVAMLERGEADGVLAWHPDRLSRNAVDGGWILDLLDRGRLRHLRFVSYTFENTPEGKFMLGMLLTKSKYDVDKLSVDVRRGMDSKRRLGHFPHRAPEGYVNDLATRTIQPDPERFPVLRQAVELVLAGAVKPPQVLRALNDEWGYRTKKTKKSGGGPLSRAAWYRLLTSPFYCGECREKGDTYAGSHRPLLTREEFDRIQALLGRAEKPRQVRHRHPLSGLIRCGRCGCMVTATISKGHTYYHCTNGRGTCDRKGVREEVLLSQVEEKIAAVSIPEWTEPVLMEAVRRFAEAESGKKREVKSNRSQTLEGIERQRQALVGMRLRELLSDEEFVREKARLAEEAARLERAEADAEGERERALAAAEGVISYAAWARKSFAGAGADERRRLAGLLGTNHCLTGGNLLLEVNPALTYLAAQAAKIEAFKPTENGSGKAKRTVSYEKVLHGWACETAVKLCSLLASRPGQSQACQPADDALDYEP